MRLQLRLVVTAPRVLTEPRASRHLLRFALTPYNASLLQRLWPFCNRAEVQHGSGEDPQTPLGYPRCRESHDPAPLQLIPNIALP